MGVFPAQENPKTGRQEGGMSQSLNRIRSLVAEIDQIQKRGQRATRTFSFPETAPNPVAIKSKEVPTAAPAPITNLALDAAPPEATVPPVSQVPAPSPTVEAESKPLGQTGAESRVKVQWTGAVILELELADSGERVELRQRGDLIEIHFSDGKAFHIPLKFVA